uniref:oligosaccharide flippase family protein n=1 Tax=Methanothrix sp. TaxID=90426 RepID=UPI0034E21CCF
MSEYKLLAQRIGLIGLANVLVNLSGIFLLPVLTKSLPVEDYGIWAQVNVTISLVSVIICLGLSASMVRFMAASSSREEIQECFYSILAVVMVSGLVASALIFYLAEPIAGALFNGNVAVTRALSVIVFLEAMNVLLFDFYRALQRMKLYALFSTSVVYLTIILAYWFVSSGKGIYGAVQGLAIAKLIILIIMFSLLVRHIGIRVPQFRRLMDYLSFGLPIVPASISSWVINSSDRYVIGVLLGTAWVGYYSPGYLLGSLVSIFIGPLNTVLPVALYRYYDRGDVESVETIMSLTIKYFLAVAIPAVFGLTFLSKPMLVMLSTPDIAEKSYLITPIVAVGMIFLGIASVMSNVIYIIKKTKISTKLYFIASIINLSFTFILVHFLQILGAAIATFLTFLFILIAIRYIVCKFVQVRIYYAFILKCFVASAVMTITIYIWPPE